MKWLSVAFLAAGASMVGGAFSIWATGGWRYFWTGMTLIVIAGAIEAGIFGHLREYLAWRRRYRFALREQKRLHLQVETRIGNQNFDRATLDVIGQLLDTEDDSHLDTLSDAVAFIVARWTDTDDAMIRDLVCGRLGRFWHQCSLARLARLWTVLAEAASTGQSNKVMGEAAGQLLQRLQCEVRSGSIASRREVAMLRAAVQRHPHIVGKVVILQHLSAMDEAALSRQALTKLV